MQAIARYALELSVYYPRAASLDDTENLELLRVRALLDAHAARLAGLSPHELNFVLDTFRALKEKEIKQYGEYRTRRLVAEAWDYLGFGETRDII